MGWANRSNVRRPGTSTGGRASAVSFPAGSVRMDHERYLRSLKDCLRPLLASMGWEALSPQGKLRKFRAVCRACPDLQDLWPTMDKAPQNWFEAMDYCTRAIEREG